MSSRSYRRLVPAVVALLAGILGAGLFTGTAEASPVGIVKAVQCPMGYQLNPQNTQQCVPSMNPYGGKGMPAGIPG